MKKIKGILAVLSLLVMAGIGGLTSASAQTANPTTLMAVSAGKQDACEALKQIDATHGCGSKDTTVNRIIRSVIQVLAYIVGFVAVIMIIIAGFKYVTSGGDSGSIASAKTTLIYAIVGLVVAALAQVIVSTVLSGAINSTTDCPTNKTISASNANCKP